VLTMIAAFSKAKGTCLFQFSYVFAGWIPESKALQTNDRAKEIAATFKDPNCLYLGRGYNFRLHLKEL
jgi:hypothetical protein